MRGENDMRANVLMRAMSIVINERACEELKRLVKYRMFKLGVENPCRRMNYSHKYIVYEMDVLKKLLKMLENLDEKREVIL